MRTDKNFWLYHTPVAHRGLWNSDIIENSLLAYQNAVNSGYPIEIDLFLSKDDQLFSFHDDNLLRMTGTNGNIFDKTAEEIKSLSLLNSKEKIPTFKEVLECVNGKVPLLIELKNQPGNIVEKTLEALKDYNGEYAIQSFNPLYILKVKKANPNIIRGILATADKNELNSQKPFIRYIIKHTALNFLIKPDFISYDYRGLPLKKRKTKNKHVIAWTVTSSEIQQKIKPYCENIIFENFIPE